MFTTFGLEETCNESRNRRESHDCRLFFCSPNYCQPVAVWQTCLLSAVVCFANNCLWQISDFENEFSVAICQPQQSTIATASLGLLKPAAVVSNGNRYYIL